MSENQISIVIKAQDLSSDVMARVRDKAKELGDELKHGAEATDGWLPLLKKLGDSWMARIAEGVLLRDAIHEIIGKVGELVSLLPEIALKGAGVADVEENFQHLNATLGRNADTLMGALRAGTHSTISDFELMKIGAKDLTAGLNLTDKQFGILATGAFALAKATGVDVKSALDTMNDAMLTGRTRSLALLTGKIDETAAEEKYAQSVGKSADQLTDAGKMEAKRAAILDAVAAATGRLGEQTDGLGQRVQQAETLWANFEEDLGKTLATSKVLQIGLDGVAGMVVETFGSNKNDLIRAIADSVDRLEVGVVSLAKFGVEAGGFVVEEWYAVKKVFGDVLQVVELTELGLAKVDLAVSKGHLKLSFDGESIKFYNDRITELTGTIDHLSTTTTARGAALQEDDKKQAAVAGTVQRYNGILEELRAKMEAARTGASDFVGPLQQEAGAHGAAAAGAGRHGEALFKLNEAQKKYAEAWQELNSTEIDQAAVLDSINPKTLESVQYYLAAGHSIQQVAAAFPELTKSQVTAVEATHKAAGEISKLWGEVGEAWISADQASLSFHLQSLDAKQRAEETHAAETFKNSDQLGEALVAIQSKYDGLRSQEIDKAGKKDQATLTKYWDAATEAWADTDQVGLAAHLSMLDAKQAREEDAARQSIQDENNLGEALLAIQIRFDGERNQESTKAARARTDELASIDREYAQTEIGLILGDTLQAQLAANKAALDDHLLKLRERFGDDEEILGREVALYQEKARAIILANDPVYQDWKKLTSDMHSDWVNLFDALPHGASSALDAVKKLFGDLKDDLLKIFSDILRGWVEGMLARMLTGGQAAAPGLAGIFAGLMPKGSTGAGTFAGSSPLGGLFGGLVGGGGSSTPIQAGSFNDAGEWVTNAGGGGLGSAARFGGGGLMAATGAIELIGAQGKLQNTLAGAQTGAGIGTMILPGIGTAIGAGAGALVGLLKGLFSGPSKDEQAGRADVGGFEQQIAGSLTAQQKAEAGGEAWKETVIGVRDAYLKVGKTAAEAEHDVAAMWDAEKNGPAAVAAAMKPMHDAFAQLDKDQALLAKYGVGWTELGADVKNSHISDETQGILEDFAGLQRQGLDNITILTHTHDQFSTLYQDIVKAGVDAPASLKELFQPLIDMGLLVDADGKKVTDLANIHFAGLSDAAAKAAKDAQAAIDGIHGPKTIDIGVNLDPNQVSVDHPDWRTFGGEDVPGHAAGGLFAAPHLARIAENEPEIVGDQGFMTRALEGALRRVNAPAAVGGGSITTTRETSSEVTHVAPVILFVDRGATVNELVEKVISALPQQIRRNVGGLRTDIFDALSLKSAAWTGA